MAAPWRSGGLSVVGDGARSARRLYSAFGEAATGFRQALVLWPESPEAALGAQRASMAAAKLALANGDLGFADVHVARLDAAARAQARRPRRSVRPT
jgi:hypothetical protein